MRIKNYILSEVNTKSIHLFFIFLVMHTPNFLKIPFLTFALTNVPAK